MSTRRFTTEKQREAARATAKRLVAEGRFGGSYGRSHVMNNGGGRRYSRAVPKARELLDWQPTVDFRELVHLMVDAELARLAESGRGSGAALRSFDSR